MPLIKKDWMPNCAMKRIICHWTAGAYRVSSHDKACYHILIEKDGNLVRGTHSIADNVSTADGVYAAHTLGCNTGSIGVSICAMQGAFEKPFDPGRFPMLEVQWQTMAQVVAELCQFYRIPVTPRTVLGHGEVQGNLGIMQKGKWDPMVLPWDLRMSMTQVGNFLRTLVQNYMEGGIELEEVPSPVEVSIRGKKFAEAFISNGSSYVRIRPVATTFGRVITHADEDDVIVRIGDTEHDLSSIIMKTFNFVPIPELAAIMGVKVSWDPAKRIFTLA